MSFNYVESLGSRKMPMTKGSFKMFDWFFVNLGFSIVILLLILLNLIIFAYDNVGKDDTYRIYNLRLAFVALKVMALWFLLTLVRIVCKII